MQSVIFFDIDGTIVTEDERHFIPESTRLSIARARRNGHLTFINTGRTAFNINHEVRSLGFDGYVCGCGTYIEYNDKILFSNDLEQSFCCKIADIIRKCNAVPVYEHRDGYFFDDAIHWNDKLHEFLEVFVDPDINISKRVDDDDFIFDKFVVWLGDDTDREMFFREIEPYFTIIDRGGDFYENVPLGCTKATGVAMILEMLGIAPENSYAIGDSMNDLPMLQAVPNSIAMGNAEQLYPYVSYITSSIEENGIEKALKHYNLI